MLSLRNIHKQYRIGTNFVKALDAVSLSVGSGERLAIMGASGSGKTSLMNIIGLLDRPTTGEYHLTERNTNNFTSDELAGLRNQQIGFVFQSFHLLPRLSALQNVGLPLQYAGVSRHNIERRAMVSLEAVGMQDFAHHRPRELSGGQQQRIAIARALINNPSLLLADEPTGALDSQTSEDVLELILNANQEATVVIVTHDRDVAMRCDRVVQLNDGSITT